MDDRDRDAGTDDTLTASPDDGHAATLAAPSLGPVPPAPSLATASLPTMALGARRARTPSRSSPTPDGPRYALGDRLGEGGMGEVLLAVDEQIGREVAVKRIRAADPTPEELARFVREARVQGRLEHPAVVPVHDLALDASGRPFFVMKRLTGTTMNDLLRRARAGGDGAADEAAVRRRLLRAFADVCLAVEFAHSRGIIHRDLKPANIMLGDFGEVYVLDWGVARAVTEPDEAGAPPSGQHDLKLDTGDTQVGTVLGTPMYMAPEQLAGGRAGPAADIYALGCILFEILAGEPLHERARSAAAPRDDLDARPSARRADVPPELDAICARAAAAEPAARFASARALGDAVQAFLDGDRDVAVRRELARHHLDEARAALARGDAEADRREAMAAAGRALALDPTARDAAELVSHLILRPPPEVPREVEERLVAIDTDTARSQGRLAAAAVLGYLGFVPMLLWTGVRDPRALALLAALSVLSGVQVLWMTRKDRISTAGIYLNACTNAVLIALVCRLVGPFVIAPALVTTTLMVYAAHPGFGRVDVIAVILAAAVAIPWGLEIAGVLAPTYRFDGGALVLDSPNVTFSAVPVQLAFALVLVALVAIVAILLRSMARRQRAAQRSLELQAWHLRQIVAAPAR